ncbi:hypothetical protein DPMN_168290 [Dreissena polymorpha]|uniref:Uncharacterized protein n=1 Tax=Dreissena polymorpha TaxID=45954 RepID=A0A9D4F5B5_DREPO|nr:hypothetical protein DPMN_168290 [Dreissena polymorpha]
MIGQQLKTASPTGGHVFQRIGTTFELNQDIMKTNILTNFELGRYLIGTKVLTKFHEDWTRNEASTDKNVLTKFHEDWATQLKKTRVLIRFYHVFQANIIIFELILNTIETNSVNKEKFPTPGGHVFKATKNVFELIQDIIGTNLQTRFHDDRKINVASRVGDAFFTDPNHFRTQLSYQKTHVLTKFHDHWTKNVTSRVENCPAPRRPCFFTDLDHFELVQEINKTNVLTNFHDDWAKIVTSRHNKETAPPTSGHVFQHTGTTFELNQDIIKKNILTNFKLCRDFIGAKLLTKFHEDWTRNVASRVFTSKCLRTNIRRTKTGQKSSPEQSVTQKWVWRVELIKMHLHMKFQMTQKWVWRVELIMVQLHMKFQNFR